VPNTDLTTSEVAARLGVSVSSVHRLVTSGVLVPRRKLPGLRGALLFDPKHVDRVARHLKAAS